MKNIPYIKVLVSVLVFLGLFSSCEKDPTPPITTTTNTSQANLKPIARVGSDITITMPDKVFATLDGSASSDPVGSGLTYSWRKLSGDTVLMRPLLAASMEVLVFLPGDYTFELTVTDTKGETATDVVKVSALMSAECKMNQQLVRGEFRQVAKFSNSPLTSDGLYSSVTRNARMMFWAGGASGSFPDMASDMFVRYDMETKQFKEYVMPVERYHLAAAANDNYVFLAGGTYNSTSGATDRVEVFDLETEKFSLEKLSVARTGITGVAVGSQFVFAGGVETGSKYSDVVDIYDLNRKAWSVAKLSEPRLGIEALVSGTKVYFSGGIGVNDVVSNRIDIYDQSTGQWSVSTMSLSRINGESALLGNRIFFLGGSTNANFERLNKMEVFNTDVQSSVVQCAEGTSLYSHSSTNSWVATAGANQLYYLGDHVVSRYNAEKDTWTKAILPSTHDFVGLFTYKDEVYVIGYKGADAYIMRVTM